MFPLLEVSLLVYLVGISGKGWAKKMPSKFRNESVVASFTWQSFPWCHVHFSKNEMLECEITVPLGYYSKFYGHHIQKLYQKLRHTEFFPTQMQVWFLENLFYLVVTNWQMQTLQVLQTCALGGGERTENYTV